MNSNSDKEPVYDEIRKIRFYSSEQFDKQIVYISSGALILSIGFVREIVQIEVSNHKLFLIVAWCSFAISIISNLVSHKTAITALDFNLEGNEKREASWNGATQYLNNISLVILIIGVISFVLFVSLNI